MNKKLPSEIEDKIKERFGRDCGIKYQENWRTITIQVGDCASYLTFENFKFLADLFQTTKVDTGIYVGAGGCPTCDGDFYKDITFTVSEVVLP